MNSSCNLLDTVLKVKNINSEKPEWLYGYNMVVRVSVYPRDGMADRGVLAVAALHYQRRVDCVLLAREKIQIQNLKYVFC